jgi:hypothetical protein
MATLENRMAQAIQNPKVFVSYSWTSEVFKEQVLQWASDLKSAGIQVILDRWHLRPGHDANSFMEQMVAEPTVSRVLCFCDAIYSEKADGRKGGVGTESQIISPLIYANTAQTKFIPIVCEFREGAPCLPIFLKSRIFIDFSTPEKVNANWQRLVRLIYGLDENVEPSLGPVPSFILDPTRPGNTSARKLENYVQSVRQGLQTTSIDREDYLEAVTSDLLKFQVPSTPENPGGGPENYVRLESILDQMLPYRDELLRFFRLHSDPATNGGFEIIAKTLEELLTLKFPEGWAGSNGSSDEQYALFLHELFVYTVAQLLRLENFDACSGLLERKYWRAAGSGGNAGHESFRLFFSGSDILARKNRELQLNRLSSVGDLFKSHATITRLPFETFIEAEVLLFLRSLLHLPFIWFPHTIFYIGWSETLPIFLRSRQRRVFAELCKVLGVRSKDEFGEIFSEKWKFHRMDQYMALRIHGTNMDAMTNFDLLDTI